MTWSRGPAIALFVTGAFELVLAVVFAAIGFSIGEAAKFGMLLTAGVLAVTALGLLYGGQRMNTRYKEAQRIRADGETGQAQVLSLTQTGSYMNNQPKVRMRLRITTLTHGTYDIEIAEYVPLMAIGRLSNGSPLAVRVDRQDPTRVVIDWSGAAQLAPAVPGNAGVPTASRERLLATGVAGQATVLSATATGQLDEQSRPVYDLMLLLQVPGRPAASGPARVGVPVERVSLMQPGGVIPIKADPGNPAVMAADWDRIAPRS